MRLRCGNCSLPVDASITLISLHGRLEVVTYLLVLNVGSCAENVHGDVAISLRRERAPPIATIFAPALISLECHKLARE